MSIEIKISDIFHLQTGATVFAGLIIGEKEIFKDNKMQLWIDNKEYQTVNITGEMLMDRKHPLNHRAVSTYDAIELTSDFVRSHECKLI
ncbi:MAG: hypothetical protein AAF652_01385 [Cyanobacteria bacterium P01_C01_bin.72]